jgi:hypothetical protein
MEAYERFLQEFGTDYRTVDHRRIGEAEMTAFFGPGGHRLRRLPNEQRLDREGLRGRLLSTSYVPEEGQPRHREMLAALERLFDEHQEGGTVTFVYSTRMYYAEVRPPR